MNCISSEAQGIGVDVHVHRITHRLHWATEKYSVKKPTESTKKSKVSPEEQTRLALESWLPEDFWKPINPLLVGYGQLICTALSPKCQQCVVSQFCPSAKIPKM